MPGRYGRGLAGGTVLAWLVLSRLVVLVAALLAEIVIPRNPALTFGSEGPMVASLTSWDGWWYLSIAREGYHTAPLVDGYHDYAFLPLYPLLVRLLAVPWPAWDGLVAVLLSNALFVVGLSLLVRLGRDVLRDDRAERGAMLLTLSPFSAVFSMAYAESLFLVLSVGAFLAAERGRRPLAGMLLALAALTRLQGLVLVLPLWLVLLVRDGRQVRLSQGWLLAGPLVAGGFMAFVAVLTGTVTGYAGAQGGWGRTGPSLTPSGGSIASDASAYQLMLLGLLLVGVFLLVYLRPDRIPLRYGSIPVLYLGLEIASGILEAVGRILTLAFPYAWVLAGRRARWFRLAWPLVSLALLLLASTAMFAGYFVP